MKTKSILLTLLLSLGLSASAQDWAKANLEKSSRHQEWVDVKHGSRTVHSFIVYPEVKGNATAVIVIHENKGLTDWARSVADQLAAAGYIAIAPDLLSGTGPKGGNTDAYASVDAATAGIYKLSNKQVTADLNAVADYVKKLPAANGKLAVAGFCWGGGQSFRFATDRADLKSAFVFYGTGPEDAKAIEKIKCPVYGFYGGNDNRVDSTIPQSEKLMKAAGKSYEPVKYEGAGHGFMRAGEEPKADDANKKARDAGWQRMVDILRGINRSDL